MNHPMRIAYKKVPCFLLLTSLAILTGCLKQSPFSVATPPSISPTSWGARQTELEKLQHFELSGVIGLTTPKKSVSANLHWKQEGPSQYTFNIIGPIGMGGINLDKNQGVVTLVSDKQHRQTGNNATALIYQNIGVMVPVENLYYWIRGLPAPGSITQKTLTPEMTLSELKQDNWHIEYLRYDTPSNLHLSLPTKIQISHGEFRVKIVINHWAYA